MEEVAFHEEEENIPLAPITTSKFRLPDTTSKIHQLIRIINQHPGEEEIHIGEKSYKVSPEGKEKVVHLL